MGDTLKTKNVYKLFITCCAIIIICGACVRLYFYLGGTGLWLDEGFLFYTLYKYDFTQIISEPLLLTQSAPLGFMLASKSFTMLFGFNEYTLRFLPFLCGCLIPLLVFAMLKNYAIREIPITGLEPRASGTDNSGRMEQWAIILALLFTAFEYHLILYSNEFKQYSVEAFASTAVLCLVSRTKRKSLIFVCGLAAMLFSSPAVFVLAGVFMAMLFEAVPRGCLQIADFDSRARKAGLFEERVYSYGTRPEQKGPLDAAIGQKMHFETAPKSIGQKKYSWGGLLLLGLGWSTFFLAYYFLYLKPSAHPDFYEYWQDWFFKPFDLDWLAAKRAYYKKRSIGPYLDALLVGGSIVLFAGFYRLTRINRLLGMSIIFSLLFTLLASALKLYPLQVRLLLFFFPPLLIVAAFGITGLISTFADKILTVMVPQSLTNSIAPPEMDVPYRSSIKNTHGRKIEITGMVMAVLLACAATIGYVTYFHSIFSSMEKQKGLKPLMPLIIELAAQKRTAIFIDVSWPLFVFYSEVQGKKTAFLPMASEKNVVFTPRMAEIQRELDGVKLKKNGFHAPLNGSGTTINAYNPRNVERIILITLFYYHGKDELLKLFAEKGELTESFKTKDTLVYFFAPHNN